ncbi:MAG: DUF6440 family protein [Candidatus Ornithomonoglobus sp.]
MKIIMVLSCAMLMLSLASCGGNGVEDSSATDNSRFVTVESSVSKNWRVVYDKNTKVMYAVSDGVYNMGTFTLLVDENGDPLLYED